MKSHSFFAGRTATWALVLSLSVALAAVPSSIPRPTLKIATWNVEWLNRLENEGKVPRSREDYLRLKKYADILDADVIALQEVDGKEAARRLFDPNRYRFHFTSDVENLQRTGFAYRKGLRVASYPDVVGLAVAGTRRGADIGIEIGRKRIRMLSIHLKTGCWGEPLLTDSTPCQILTQQLPVLERWIDARAEEQIPFLVLGDFNRRFTPNDTFWPEIDDADPPEADLTDAEMGRTSECWNGEFPEFVDHIVLSRTASDWFSPNSFAQLLFDSLDAQHKATLSDHCAISAILAIGETS